jgi:hypothetical protein
VATGGGGGNQPREHRDRPGQAAVLAGSALSRDPGGTVRQERAQLPAQKLTRIEQDTEYGIEACA